MIYLIIGCVVAAILGIGGLLKVLRNYLGGKLSGVRALVLVILTTAVGVGSLYGAGLLSITQLAGRTPMG